LKWNQQFKARALRIISSLFILTTNYSMSIWHILLRISKSLWIIPFKKLFFSCLELLQNLSIFTAFYRGLYIFFDLKGDVYRKEVVFLSLNCLWVFLGLLVVTIVSLLLLILVFLKFKWSIFWLEVFWTAVKSTDWNLEKGILLEVFRDISLIFSDSRSSLPFGESSRLFENSKGISSLDLN